MEVTVDLPDWIVKALLEWRVPEEHAGTTIEERLAFLADHSALAIIISADDEARREKLFRALGIRPADEDDDIPF